MRGGPSRRLLAGAAALATALAGSLAVLTAAPVGALTVFTVDSNADGAANATNCTAPTPGSCRLRDAFAAANAAADDVQINVTPGLGTIALGVGSLDYSPAAAHALTLAGNGVAIVQPGPIPGITAGGSATGLTVDRVSLTSGFSGINPGTAPLTVTNSSISATVTQILTTAQGIFSSGPVVITGSTITATEGPGSSSAAVAVTATTATVTDSQITASGAISNDARALVLNGAAAVSVTGSQLTAIHAGGLGGGFGILSLGTAPVSVTTSTIRAGGGGGFGVEAGGATLTLERSTVTGGGLGGVSMFGNGAHTATLTNSTVTDNPGTGVSATVITLVYATVTNNATNPAQVNLNTPTLNTFGSVIARPGAGNANCSAGGATNSTGYNYSDDPDATTSCKLANATDRVGASNDPLLGALADNGGPTVTRLPQTGSPLIDQIPAASPCAGVNIVIDQRALPRPTTAGTFCDIGAVEVQPTTVILLAPDFAG